MQSQSQCGSEGHSMNKEEEKRGGQTSLSTTREPMANNSAVSVTSSDSSLVGVSVGRGLATVDWWNQYYQQMHQTYWDWYLPNEQVIQIINQQLAHIIRQNHMRQKEANQSARGEQQEEEEKEQENESETTTHDYTSALGRLPILQLGCGNSEITSLLWDGGIRRLENIDFSDACIKSQRELQATKGWSSQEFRFSVMDVRELSYPSDTFELVFDKGTLDCVVLESGDGRASAQRMLQESHRVLKSGGISLCFSLYPPQQRAQFWINCIPTNESPELSCDERQELCEVMETDNPPHHLSTPCWSIDMLTLDCSPLELPNQPHTYVYICQKR